MGSSGDASPAAPEGPRGGAEGCGKGGVQGVAAAPACAPAARLPARRGTSTGPQRPLAARGCPPRGGGGGLGSGTPGLCPLRSSLRVLR